MFLLLFGCSSSREIQDEILTTQDTSEAFVDARRADTQQAREIPYGALRVVHHPWVGSTLVDRSHLAGLPPHLLQLGNDVSVRVVAASPDSRGVLADTLRDTLGMPVQPDPSVLSYLAVADPTDIAFSLPSDNPEDIGYLADLLTGGSGAGNRDLDEIPPVSLVDVPIPGESPLPDGLGPDGPSGGDDSGGIDESLDAALRLGAGVDASRFFSRGWRLGPLQRDFVFTGSVPDLLDAAAAALGFERWRVTSGPQPRLFLVSHSVEEFRFPVAKKDFMDSLKKPVTEAVRSRCGGCFVVLQPALGTIQVIGSPSAVEGSKSYIADYLDELREQLVVEFSAYTVSRELEDNFSLDMKASLDFSIGKFKASGISLNRIGSVSGDGLGGFSLNTETPASDDKDIIFDAISRLGRTSSVFDGTFFVMNHRTVEIDLTRDLQYQLGSKSEIKESNVGDGGGEDPVASEPITKDGKDGRKFALTPRLLPGSEVLVHYNFDDDSVSFPLDELDPDFVGLIQITSKRKIENELVVPLGSYLVFNAYRTVKSTANRSGPFSHEVALPSGSRAMSSIIEDVVVALRVSRAAAPSTADPALALSSGQY